jgi:hypothetical protein
MGRTVASGEGWRIEKLMVCLTCTQVLDGPDDAPIRDDHPGHLLIVADTFVWVLLPKDPAVCYNAMCSKHYNGPQDWNCQATRKDGE